MEYEIRRRDTKTTIEDDTSSDTMSSSSVNDEYLGDIKKDMRYSYGKTPDGKGTALICFQSVIKRLTLVIRQFFEYLSPARWLPIS